MKDSEIHMIKIKDEFNGLTEEISTLYNILYQEIRQDIIHVEEKREKVSKETDEIYEMLDDEKCAKLIKSILPLRIKLINKVKCHGKGEVGNGRIEIYYDLNSSDYRYTYEFTIEQIKYILKLENMN